MALNYLNFKQPILETFIIWFSIISPHVISPQIHFTPHLNYQMRLRLMTKAIQFQS